MHAPIIETQSLTERLAFVSAVERAEKFENLPIKYQTVVIAAERQLYACAKAKKPV